MSDRDLQDEVQNALAWEPSVDAARIGVSVGDGVVTLHGDVSTYSEKVTAERVTAPLTQTATRVEVRAA